MIRPVVRRVSSSILVSRVVERARLVAALDAAEQGEPGLVLIGGEAGIGKTRLATDLATVSSTRGALVIRGQCLDTKATALPFAPFVEILSGLRLSERIASVAGPEAAGIGELARLVPMIGRSRPSDSRRVSGDDQLRLFHAVSERFTGAARDRLLLLVIEDLHWADASSLDLLRFVAGGMSTERLLMLATFRSDELRGRHPLSAALGELVRLPHVARLDLSAFTEREVADQLTGIGGRRPTDDAVSRTFARSDGNPFFVEELAGHGPDGPLPPTLRDALATRLADLSPDARVVVAAAATIGREVGHALLARIAPLPERQLLHALREATDHHVLVRADRRLGVGFAFRHALIQEFAYGELLPNERAALHRAIVEALQASGGSSGEIARHAYLARDLPLALALSAAAADEAAESLAFAEALAHAERALELWSEVIDPEASARRDHASLSMLSARCAAALGRWSEAANFGRMALARLAPEQRTERIALLLDVAHWHSFADDETGRAAALDEAAALSPPHPPTALRARVLADLAHFADDNGRVTEARRLAEEAIGVSRVAGARAEEARALVRLAEVLAGGLAQPEAASQLLVDAERIAAESSEPQEHVLGLLTFRKADFALMAGEFADAVSIADAGVARAGAAGRLGERVGFLRALKIAGLAALGRWDEAEVLFDEARRDPSVVTVRNAIQNFVEVLVRQGRLAEATSAVHETDFGYVTANEGSWILQTRIRLANAEGRWDDARAAADEAVGLFRDEAEANVMFLLEHCVRGEADRAEVARDRRRTAEEAETRRVGIERLSQLRRIAQAAIALGGAGKLIEAILATAEAEGSRLERQPDAVLWGEAVRRREALGQRWETGYARFRQAEAILGKRGSRSEAQALLREAHGVASELRALPLVDQIESLARRGRIRLQAAAPERRVHRAMTAEGVIVALTTREWEVLSLVAAGHTNREIGAELFISEKTASVHITNVMDKLGALSRYDAAASAVRLGLLDATPGRSQRRT